MQRSQQHIVAGAELLDSRGGDGGLPRRSKDVGVVERLRRPEIIVDVGDDDRFFVGQEQLVFSFVRCFLCAVD